MTTDAENTAHDANAVQAALDAGRAMGTPQHVKPGAPYVVVVPKGASHALVRVPPANAEFDDAPTRSRGTYQPATVDALIDVAKRHHDEKATTIWVHPTNGRIVAIFNDAHPGSPAWRDHKAVLNLTVPPEWQHWAAKDGKLMGQVEFAEHVEDGLAEIVEPNAADMLEIAQTFHAHTTAQFRSANLLHSGQVQVRYDEETTATAGKSANLEIPQTFKIAVPPFIGEDAYGITARLRYRVRDGKLLLGYKLDQPDRVVRAALSDIAEKLKGEFPSVFIGEPGA